MLTILCPQENAAYLYDELMRTECRSYAKAAAAKDRSTSATGSNSASGSLLGLTHLVRTVRRLLSRSGPHNEAASSELAMRTECERYFVRLSRRRWLQLAAAGEVTAVRTVAAFVPLPPPHPGRKELNRTHGGSVDHFADLLPVNFTVLRAAELYAAAASQGDSQSMLGLGWILAFGHAELGQKVIRYQHAISLITFLNQAFCAI